jgi:hypothetical protein
MTTNLDFLVVAVPVTLAVVTLLVFGSRHIHGQMERIAETAEARSAARPQRAFASNSAQAYEVPVPLEKRRI